MRAYVCTNDTLNGIFNVVKRRAGNHTEFELNGLEFLDAYTLKKTLEIRRADPAQYFHELTEQLASLLFYMHKRTKEYPVVMARAEREDIVTILEEEGFALLE